MEWCKLFNECMPSKLPLQTKVTGYFTYSWKVLQFFLINIHFVLQKSQAKNNKKEEGERKIITGLPTC